MSADQVPGICTDLLVDGYDTPSLRVLAGLTATDGQEVRELLPRVFHEMGMEEPSPIQAAWFLAQSTARDIVSGTVAPSDGARAIGDLGSTFDPLWPSLSIFIGLSSEWDDHPQQRQAYDSDIREEAARLIVMQPPSEPGTGSEVDRLVQVAKQQELAGHYDMHAVAEALVKKTPAGRILGGRGRRWIAIASHNDRQVLLLHATLPFGFIRPEYRHFVQSVVDDAGIQLADMASADTKQLSVTQDTLETLANRKVVLPGPIGWLSANQVRKLTGE
jgi:hypothetical protein